MRLLCCETGQDHGHLRPAAAAAENVSEAVVAVVDVIDHAVVNELAASSCRDSQLETQSETQ